MARVSSGQICWVKTSDDTAALTGGAQWWPGVVFQSWEDLEGWELPVAPADDRDEVKSDEVVACLLENYGLVVVDAATMLRAWAPLPPRDEWPRAQNDASSQRLRRAIDDAEALARMGDGSEALVDERRPPAKKSRSGARKPAAAKPAAAAKAPSDWRECLRLAAAVPPDDAARLKAILELALAAATRGAGADVVAKVEQALKDAAKVGPAKTRAAALRCLPPDDDLEVSDAAKRYVEALPAAKAKRARNAPTPKAAKAPPATLASVMASGALTPGPLRLSSNDGSALAALEASGAISFLGASYGTVDAFVAAARSSAGLRVQRPVPEHKLWARVTHVRTKKPLSAFLPEEPPSDDEPEAPPKKKREAPRKKKEDPPKQDEAAPKKEEKKQEAPAEDEDEGTPLSDYWLGDAVGSSSKNPGPGAARVWDDGFFTDDERADGFEVEGDEPALGAKPPTKAALKAAARDDEDDANGKRASAHGKTLRGGARRDAALRVTKLVEGFASSKLSPHALVTCEAYGGADEQALRAEAQPFALKVHPDVAFLCDLHAHLADAEIIGLLGGRWDAAAGAMHVQAPFPCRATGRDDDGATDVEMDPASELAVREVIKAHAMDVVGWYHSHPRFVAQPSVTDIENQGSYQALFAAEGGPPPFVGLIVGTYDTANADSRAQDTYFHVARPPPDLLASARGRDDDGDGGGGGGDGDARKRSRREPRAAAAAAQSAPPVVPMALDAVVRCYRRDAGDEDRAARRARGAPPPPPPDPAKADAPFGFLLACACCAPGSGPCPNLATAASVEELERALAGAKSAAAAAPDAAPAAAPAAGTRRAAVAALVARVGPPVTAALEKLAAKLEADPAGAAQVGEGMWKRLLTRYGGDDSELACVVHTIGQLGVYYAASDRRVDLAATWRDMPKWVKLLHSLAPRTFKMALAPEKRHQFLADVLVYLHVCWAAAGKPKRKRKKSASRTSSKSSLKDED